MLNEEEILEGWERISNMLSQVPTRLIATPVIERKTGEPLHYYILRLWDNPGVPKAMSERLKELAAAATHLAAVIDKEIEHGTRPG